VLDLIPHDDLKKAPAFNFAPMIDFLFLMLSLFATLAISRASLVDSEVSLVELKPEEQSASSRAKRDFQQINLSISSKGTYKWLTEFDEYPMSSIQEIQRELMHQMQIGALPQEREKIEILLHIDQNAPWKPIAEAIFAIRECGFSAHPVYEPLDAVTK
jgi:biopolymer transport protein ExbD